MKEYSYGVVPVYTHDTEDLYLLIKDLGWIICLWISRPARGMFI